MQDQSRQHRQVVTHRIQSRELVDEGMIVWLGAQGVWTDGALGVSVGLDQRLRTWWFTEELPCGDGADAETAGRGGTPARWTLSEGVSTVVQVLEPAALSVVRAGVHAWHAAVAGRGTQVLRICKGH